MPKRRKMELPPPPPWLVSWGDLNTLLLTFFIMLFEISPVITVDFNLILSSFRGSLGLMEGGQTLTPGRMEEMGHNMLNLPATERETALAKMVRRAVEAYKPEIQAKEVRVREDERGLVITLSSDAFFDPGSAKLKEDIIPVLNKAAIIIKSVPNFVRVEGHTDDRPVPPRGLEEGYATNWELSSARAVNVLRYLIEENDVDPRQMSAVAFGEHRPIDDNETPEGRAYNRRVDIVILRDKVVTEPTHPKISKPLPGEEWR